MITIFVIGLLYSEVDVWIFNSAILSWVDIDDSSDGPVSTNRVGIFHDDYVIHSHSALFSIPLLSGDQRREHVSVQRLQKVSTSFCTNSTLCRGFLVSLNGPCGTIEVARPRSMSLGYRYELNPGR